MMTAIEANSLETARAVAVRADIHYLRPTRLSEALIAVATERIRFGPTESAIAGGPR